MSDLVWQRIVMLQGQTFHQKTGKPFTYAISGSSVVPSTTNRQLARFQFARAYERAPPGVAADAPRLSIGAAAAPVLHMSVLTLTSIDSFTVPDALGRECADIFDYSPA